MAALPPDSPASTASQATSTDGSTDIADFQPTQDGLSVSVEDMYRHGISLLGEKKFEDAVRVLTAVVQEDSQYFEAYQARGQAYLELHNYGKAITDFRRATEMHPNASSDHQRAIAHYYLHLFAKLEADAPSASLPTYFGSEPLSISSWKHYNRALSAYYLGQYESAVVEFSRVLSEHTTFAAGFRCRGTAYLHMGQFTSAIVDLLESSRLDPCFTTYYNLGLAYGNLSQFESAVKHFTHAITLNPQDASTYNNRGISQKSMRQYETAIADFSVAISLNVDSASAPDHRGQCYAELGDHHAAIDDFTSALKLQPSSARYQRRATSQWALGAKQEALADLGSALALALSRLSASSQPLSSSAFISKSTSTVSIQHAEIASLFLQRGRYLLDEDLVKAESDLSASLKHNPASVEALYARSSVRRLLNNRSGAYLDLQAASALDGTQDFFQRLAIHLGPF